MQIAELFRNYAFLIPVVFLIGSIAGLIAFRSRSLWQFVERYENHSYTKWTVFACIIYSLVFSTIALCQHFSLHTHAHDLGWLDQVVWSIIHGTPGYNTINNDNYFSWHFSIILFLIAPFYLIWESPCVLLILQSVALGFAALPLYLFASKKTKNNLFAFIVSLSFLLSPFVQSANLFDFHQDTLEAIFIFSAVYFAGARKPLLYFVTFILTLMCKLDTALYFFVFGCILILVSYEEYFDIFSKKFKVPSSKFKIRNSRDLLGLGVATSAISILYFLVTLFFIIPALTPTLSAPILPTKYAWLGGNALEIFKNIFSHPFKVLEHILDWNKLSPDIRLFLPLMFLNFFSFRGIILPALPIAVLLLSGYQPHYTLASYYGMTPLPWVYIGAVFGWLFFEKRITHNSKLKFNLKSGTWNLEQKIKPAVLSFILVASFFSNFAFAPDTFNMRKCKREERQKFFWEIKKIIPKDASLSAQMDLLPHLAHRKKLYLFPVIKDAEYILLDTKGNKNPCNEEEFTKHLKKLYEDKKFMVKEEKEGYLLFGLRFTVHSP